MSEDKKAGFFDRDMASKYEDNFSKLSPLRDNLQMLAGIILSALPDDARILCVGAGTGLELRSMAKMHPGWTFTAVDPSGPMLEQCRKHAEAEGIAARCSFHEGYLDSLPETAPFDGATCLLVSHFLMEKEARIGLFAEIRRRLKPGGYLVSADLASDMSSRSYKELSESWMKMLGYAGFPEEKQRANIANHGVHASLLPLEDVAAMIEAGGFTAPTQFFQSLLIHGWYARSKEG